MGYRRRNVVDPLDTTKQSPITRASLVTDTPVTPYGVDLLVDGRIECPGTPPMTAGSEERV